MMRLLCTYVLELFHFARAKLFIDLVLTVVLGLLEGVTVVMLVPLLSFVGISSNHTAGFGCMVEQYLGFSGVSLPLVLVVYISIIVGQGLLERYASILRSTIQETFDSFLNTNLYRALTYARWSFFLEVKRADIAHVITNELYRVSAGTYYFLQVIASSILTVIQLGIAYVIAPYLTILVMSFGLVLFCCLHYLVKETRRVGRDISNHTSDLFSEVNEHLNGIKEVKSYGCEQLQVKNFEGHSNKVAKTFIGLTKLQSQISMIYKVGAAVFISIFYYSAIEIFHSEPQDLLIIFVVFSRLWPRLSSLQGGIQSIVTALPAFQAVTELRTRCLAEGERAVSYLDNERINLQMGITVSNVSFRYNASNVHYAVKRANLNITAGTTTAVVGVSGAGKSTLADLMLGLLVPEQGEILIDNIRLDSEHTYLWRQSIGYVPQDAFLFNTSIRKNLIWACPQAKEEEIWQALKLASIDEYVRDLPAGLDSVVGDRGISLSGGERQRIVLARALLRKPTLLILDEATSALDAENEKRIQQTVESLRGKLTILIIAHRMSTIRNADQILVMEKGRIVEQGSYQSFASNEKSRFHKLAYI